MTSKQMLRRIQEKTEQVTTPAWDPAERTTPIVISGFNFGSGPAITPGESFQEHLYKAENDALQANKCPRCHAPIEIETGEDNLLYFRCTRQPVYHEWRRTLSFLGRD